MKKVIEVPFVAGLCDKPLSQVSEILEAQGVRQAIDWRMALTLRKSWRPCAVIWWSWSMNLQNPAGSFIGRTAVPGGQKR